MPPLTGLLEGTWDSRFATPFALRESVHRSRSKFIRSYVAAMLERDLLTLSRVLRSIVRSSDSKISAIVAPDRISISQDP
jgi:hypothetical protein